VFSAFLSKLRNREAAAQIRWRKLTKNGEVDMKIARRIW